MIATMRRLWQLAEPIHAVTYFAPEARQAFVDAGLRGFWRGYFAGRAAPLGAVGPGVVTATFFGFQPEFVERAIPSVWQLVAPEDVIEVRTSGVAAALPGLLGDRAGDPAAAEAAAHVRRVMDGASPAGRPLFAANRDLPWPDEPVLAVWHAATLLREHRGDGHIVALAAAGLDPCEAHLTQIAARGVALESIAPYRGWADDDWAAAGERLRERGWLDGDGGLTAEGRVRRQEIEDTTDRLAAEPWARGRAAHGSDPDDLAELLEPLAVAVVANGGMPYPNPIGVPPPTARSTGSARRPAEAGPEPDRR